VNINEVNFVRLRRGAFVLASNAPETIADATNCAAAILSGAYALD
jgi:hypothetical protein